MANAIRSIACAGSIIGAGLGAGGTQGYFVVLLGSIGLFVFGLFPIRTIVGPLSFGRVMEYLFSPESATDDSFDLD
jgi:hypothetical protein